MRSLAAAALGVTCALAALCPADTSDAGATTGTGTGMQATLQRSRLFETQRALRLVLRNGGDRELAVTAVQLDSPLFDSVTPQERDPVLEPGGDLVAMPLQFGEADCGDDVGDAPPRLVTVVDGDEVAVDLGESPSGLLAELHAAECAVAAVREDVDLRLGDTWERTGPRTVEGEIEVARRRPGVDLAVESLEGNVIFTLETLEPPAIAPPPPVLSVDDVQPSDTVEVAITASRCDPHALIEYKRTFIFLALVDVGEERPLRVDIPAEGDALPVFEDLLTACLG